jgi:hypothetical protein
MCILQGLWYWKAFVSVLVLECGVCGCRVGGWGLGISVCATDSVVASFLASPRDCFCPPKTLTPKPQTLNPKP